MTIRRIMMTTCAAAALAVPASAQINIEADGTRVRIGGGQGVQVDTPDGVRSPEQSQRDRQRGAEVEVATPNARVQTGPANADGRMNRQITEWLIIDQTNMVRLADYGLQRTKTPEVKRLAEMVKQDHEQLVTRLQSLSASNGEANASDVGADAIRRPAGETVSSLPGTPDVAGDGAAEAAAENRQQRREQREQTREQARGAREQAGDARRAADGVRRPLENLGDRVEDGVENAAERTRNTAEATRQAADANFGTDPLVQESTPERRDMIRRGGYANRQGAAAGSSPWVNIHREISQQLTQQATSELESRQGGEGEFDAAFVGLITAAHMQEAATLSVLKDRASGELKNLIEEAHSQTKQHQQEAESVMKSLK